MIILYHPLRRTTSNSTELKPNGSHIVYHRGLYQRLPTRLSQRRRWKEKLAKIAGGAEHIKKLESLSWSLVLDGLDFYGFKLPLTDFTISQELAYIQVTLIPYSHVVFRVGAPEP